MKMAMINGDGVCGLSFVYMYMNADLPISPLSLGQATVERDGQSLSAIISPLSLGQATVERDGAVIYKMYYVISPMDSGFVVFH